MWEYLTDILVALACGGCIGLERELKHKPAGIKTNMLICLGSALFTKMSLEIGGDPSRIAAQIVSGIGFLGGGSIVQSRGHISGLTTAATIWVVSAVGVCIGSHHVVFGVMTSFAVVMVLVVASIFERQVLGTHRIFRVTVRTQDVKESDFMHEISALLEKHTLMLLGIQLEVKSGQTFFVVTYKGDRKNHLLCLPAIWKIPGVLDLQN